MIEPLWTNLMTRLFQCRQDSNPVWLKCVGVEKISWKDPKEAHVILRGALPTARELLRIADGDMLKLLYSECGLPSIYESEDVIMSFSNCMIRRKWIPSLTTYVQTGYEETITVYVSLECELRIDV